MKPLLTGWFVLTLGIGLATAQSQSSGRPWQTYDTSNGEWRSYAGDIGGKKYSPLDQINGDNFADLALVWEWTSVDTFVSQTTPGGGEWWAPLDTIVEALLEETPDLHRPGHRPITWFCVCGI